MEEEIKARTIKLFYQLLDEKPINCKNGKLFYNNNLQIHWSNISNIEEKYNPIKPFKNVDIFANWTMNLSLAKCEEEFLQYYIVTPERTYPVPLKLSRVENAELKERITNIFNDFEVHHLDQFLSE